jgi:hypothetical protein
MDNELEPYQINRSALIVTAKQPFVEWLHSVDASSQDIGLSEINHEPTVYLVPPFEMPDEFMAGAVLRHDLCRGSRWLVDRRTILACRSRHDRISEMVRLASAFDGFRSG